MQWAIGEGIGQYLCCTDNQGDGQNGKLYCTLCTVWLSSKGAILKDHVLAKNKNQPNGSYMPASFRLGLGFSFWQIWVPPTYGLKHAAVCRSTANCFGDRWCLVLDPPPPHHPPTQNPEACSYPQLLGREGVGNHQTAADWWNMYSQYRKEPLVDQNMLLLLLINCNRFQLPTSLSSTTGCRLQHNKVKC